MRHTGIILRVICVIVTIVLLTGCFSNSAKLRWELYDYEEMMQGDIPKDLRLTIYYMSPKILTRFPLNTDQMVSFRETKSIVVSSEKLALYLPVLKNLKHSVLQPVEEETYLNARLYYVFETGNSNKILEIAISYIHSNVFVNGIEVKDNPIFYEIIDPFLTEDAHSTLGI